MAKIKNKYKVCYQNSTKTWNNFENMFLFFRIPSFLISLKVESGNLFQEVKILI